MLFMTLVSGFEGRRPPPALVEATAKFGKAAGKKLKWTGGLLNSDAAARFRIETGKVRVSDGPFSEAKELVGGFAVLDVASREEAVEMTRQFVALHIKHWPEWSGDVELRQLTDGPPAQEP